jgi:hypothetical protein
MRTPALPSPAGAWLRNRHGTEQGREESLPGRHECRHECLRHIGHRGVRKAG